MTASPCLPSATTSPFMGSSTFSDPEQDVTNNLQLTEEIQRRILELAQKLNLGNISANTSSTPSDCSAGPFDAKSTYQLFQIDPAHLRLLITSTGQNSFKIPVSLNEIPYVPCSIGTVIDLSSPSHPPLTNADVHVTRLGTEMTNSSDSSNTPTKVSSNLLQQLLTGTDVSQVRVRSGLIEPSVCVSDQSMLVTNNVSDHFGTSDSARTPALQSTKIGSMMLQGKPVAEPLEAEHTSFPIKPVSRTDADVSSMFSTSLSASRMEDWSSEGAQLFPNVKFAESLLAILSEIENISRVKSSVTLSNISSNASVTHPNTICTVESEPSSSTLMSTATCPFRLHHLLTKNIDVSASNSGEQQDSPNIFPPLENRLSPSGKALTSVIPNHGVGAVESGCSQSPKSTPDPLQSWYPQSRPRSYSDLHQDKRYHHKLLRCHRPRSYSKVEKLTKVGIGNRDREKLTCDSSLFAQLVLSSDVSPPKTKSERYFPLSQQPLRPTDSTELEHTRESQSFANLTCVPSARNRIFEWLREADLFVAEHCYDIPLGALLAVAISPSRCNLAGLCSAVLSPSPADSIPSTAKRAVSKSWHQFLLVSLIESNFVPHASYDTLHTISSVPDCKRNRVDGSGHPLREKLLNAISSLVSLEADDSPPPDPHLLNDLTDLVTTGSGLNLSAEIYRLIRFCVLAQNAYPHHFSTSYPEALSELEMRLLKSTSSSSSFADVLRILNRLHCFDAGTLKQFFCLASDSSPMRTDVFAAALSPTRFPQSAYFSTDTPQGCGTIKRKANNMHSTNSGSDNDLSPIRMRSRAYTTNSYNKSARLSENIRNHHYPAGRPRSDTVPMDHRHELHRKSLQL